MNKLVFLLLIAAVITASGQGTVNFNNRVTIYGIDAAISYPTNSSKGDAQIAYAASAGSTNGARIDGATNSPGATAMVGLFAAPDGASENELVLIPPAVNFRAGIAAGYVNVGNNGMRVLNVAGAMVVDYGIAMVQLRAWDTGVAGATWQEAATNNRAYKGRSNLLRVYTSSLSGHLPPPPTSLYGLQPFVIRPPEPLVLNPIPDQTWAAGLFWSYQFSSNTFSAPQYGTSLNYSTMDLPPLISFDNSTRTFSGTFANAGNYRIAVVAADTNDPPFFATNSFVVTVTNLAPVLLVSLTGSGQGNVASTPAGLNCQSNCSTVFPSNIIVTLSATAEPGSEFVGWSGACSGLGDCTLLMDGEKQVSARFLSTVLYTSAQSSGTVARVPDQPYYKLGDTVSLRAVPGRWHEFLSWSDGVAVNPRSVTIGESNSYRAIFYPTTALETLTFNGASRTAPLGMPVVLVNGAFATGEEFTSRGAAEVSLYTSFPDGVLFYSLNGLDPVQEGHVYTGPFTVSRNTTLHTVALDANFTTLVPGDPVELRILPTVSIKNLGGGSVSVAYSETNEMAVLSASALAGWQFLEWRGDASGSETVTTLPLSKNRCVEALFGTSVNMLTTGGGSILQEPSSTLIPFGSTVRVTALPDAERYFVAWGNAVKGAGNPASFVVTNANPTVSALFALLTSNRFALTVLSDGGGTAVVNPPGNRFTNNAEVALAAFPETGQFFLGWSNGETNNPLQLAMTESQVITAYFTRYPSLTLEGCGEPGGGTLHLKLAGPPDTAFLVESSSNFGEWRPFGLVTNHYGTVQLSLPLGQRNSQFFRAKER